MQLLRGIGVAAFRRSLQQDSRLLTTPPNAVSRQVQLCESHFRGNIALTDL
jgi:hypothetical protein